jgi:hypothetical protein
MEAIYRRQPGSRISRQPALLHCTKRDIDIARAGIKREMVRRTRIFSDMPGSIFPAPRPGVTASGNLFTLMNFVWTATASSG